MYSTSTFKFRILVGNSSLMQEQSTKHLEAVCTGNTYRFMFTTKGQTLRSRRVCIVHINTSLSRFPNCPNSSSLNGMKATKPGTEPRFVLLLSMKSFQHEIFQACSGEEMIASPRDAGLIGKRQQLSSGEDQLLKLTFHCNQLHTRSQPSGANSRDEV